MHRMTFIPRIIFLLILFIGNSSASASNIEGIIKDTLSNEPLMGANVVLAGTSLGAATDESGKYLIRNIPAGIYTIRVTYIGYETKEESAQILENETLEKNFNLKPVGIEGETVLITAQASGQVEAINRQLSSDQIINAVSSARIQELPDANAAESIGRLPGISVLRSGGEANEVVIRGLAPKFNRIFVNGVQLNSSNPDNASIDLSMISSTMLEAMEVKKTVTADMDANVIGGVVNLELREASAGRLGKPRFGILIQGGYNALSGVHNKFNNYKYVGSGESRFFNEKLGLFIQADIERRNLTSNELGASYGNQGDQIPLYITNGLNLNNIIRDRQRYDGALVLDYKLENGTLKLSNFLSKSTTDAQNRGEYFGITGTAGSNVHNYSMVYSRGNLSVITNALDFDYQLPIFHMSANLSHAYTETSNPDDWNVTFQQGSAGLGGFTNRPNLNPKDIPLAANNNLSSTYLNTAANTSSFSGARALGTSLDLETNINFSEVITSILKFGGMYRYQYRSYSYNTTGSQGLGLLSAQYVDNLIASHFPSLADYRNTTNLPMAPFLDPNYSYGEFLSGNYPMTYPLNYGMLSDLTDFLAENSDLIQSNPQASASYFFDQFNSKTNDYTGHEDQSAVYAMVTIKIGPQITLIPGVRYQNLKTTYSGTRGIQNTASGLGGEYYHYDTTVSLNHGYWLPSVSLKINPFSWFDVRLSYSKTLAYPDYNSIIPRIDVSTAGTIAYNNYELVPSRSYNYDLYFSFYSNLIGLFTIGGFLKQIDDLIYPYSFYVSGAQALKYYPPNLAANPPTGTYQVSTYVNDPNRAIDYGFEIDWQTHFWYLPRPFDGLVLNINYTHVYSEEEYPYTNLVGRFKIPVDTSYTTRLLYQPDNIANFSIGYDYEGFSVRVSMIYQDNIFSGPNFYPQLRTNTASYTRWDVSLKQDLPWYGIQVYGDLSNLNGETDLHVIQAPTGVPQNEQEYGMTADLGVRIKF